MSEYLDGKLNLTFSEGGMFEVDEFLSIPIPDRFKAVPNEDFDVVAIAPVSYIENDEIIYEQPLWLGINSCKKDFTETYTKAKFEDSKNDKTGIFEMFGGEKHYAYTEGGAFVYYINEWDMDSDISDVYESLPPEIRYKYYWGAVSAEGYIWYESHLYEMTVMWYVLSKRGKQWQTTTLYFEEKIHEWITKILKGINKEDGNSQINECCSSFNEMPKKVYKGKAAKWMSKYGQYVEDAPDISFEGNIFVFDIPSSKPYPDNATVKKVIKAGGAFRDRVSGTTDYLVIEPSHASDSKITHALEQREKGKSNKVILLDDLKNALK